MGFSIVAGGFALILCLMFVEVPRANREVVYMAISFVLGWGAAVVSYEYGDSRRLGVQPVRVENEPSDPVPVRPKRGS